MGRTEPLGFRFGHTMRELTQGASTEDIRGINRRHVLNLIRTRQPISRAQLSRESGLQRSTISLIVEELVEDRWVLESPAGAVVRGRRPTLLRLNEERVIIGVDIRPSQTTVVVSDAHGRFTRQETLPTTPDAEATLARLAECVQSLVKRCKGKKVEGIGVSLPGRYDAATGRLIFAPNLGWRQVDVLTPLRAATGLEVVAENAANACVLAAVWFGQVEGSRDFVVVTVSEGIGTGILANGQMLRGAGGMAGEFGHVTMDPAGPECGCGGRGCWEVFASNRAGLRYFTEEGGAEVTFAELLSLAEQGDEAAGRAVQRMAEHLGRGMKTVAGALAPEWIVVVGEVTRAWARYGPVLEAELEKQMQPGARAPRVVAASEQELARLRGTVALVLQEDFGLPA